MPKADSDTERALLGVILRHPPALADAAAILTPGAFYVYANALIFEACLSLHAAGTVPDIVTVHCWLRDAGRLDDVGHAADYLVRLWGDGPSPANATRFAQRIHARYLRRRLIQVCTDLQVQAEDLGTDVTELLAQAEQAIATLRQQESPR